MLTPLTAWYNGAISTFEGTLDHKFDEDWIRVDLVEGQMYEITLDGAGANRAADTILKVFNADGEQVAFHDDIDYAAGKVNSVVQFSPDTTGVYYISVSVYLGNPTQDHSGDYRVRVFVGEEGGTPEGGDTLEGGAGDDALNGGAGLDWLAGGPGGDVLRGAPATMLPLTGIRMPGVEVRLHDGVARGGDAEGDTFAGMNTIEYVVGYDTETFEPQTQDVEVLDIERLSGSEHDDILVGNHDTITGLMDVMVMTNWTAERGLTGLKAERAPTCSGGAPTSILCFTGTRMPGWKCVCMTAWPGAAMPKAIHLSELRVSSVLNMMTYWLAPMVQRTL